MEVLSHEQQRIKSLLPRPSKDRKFRIWHNWSLFSTLRMRFKMWYGWVTEGFLPSKKMVNIFKTFMWYMRVYFTCPIQELKCTFSTVYVDILCGQSLSWLKCSNVWRKYQQTCTGNSLKTVCVVIFFEENWWSHSKGIFHHEKYQFCLFISLEK